jgi:hypothetical protein
MSITKKYKWSKLSHLQSGKFAEYYSKMEFTLLGFDVYATEVDDKGIDFVIKDGMKYYDVQVKSIRGNNYIFFPKSKFKPRENLFAVIVVFYEGEEPLIYLIPSVVWNETNELFVSRDYEGKKSQPEWGINISIKNKPLLENYSFHTIAEKLKQL